MDDFALTSAERALLAAFNHRGVRYLVIGLSAAVLQGAPVSDDVPVRVLPLERIIASKRSTTRPKDLAALPALEATVRARADSGPEDT